MEKAVKLTPEACRAGRALLRWGVRDLADNAKVGSATISAIEVGREPLPDTARKILTAFARHGVEITNGDGTGARLVKPTKRAKARRST